MPKNLKTLERNEGKHHCWCHTQRKKMRTSDNALSLRFLQSRQWRSPGTTIYTHQCIMLVAGPGAPVPRVAKGLTALDNFILSKVCWCDR